MCATLLLNNNSKNEADCDNASDVTMNYLNFIRKLPSLGRHKVERGTNESAYLSATYK